MASTLSDRLARGIVLFDGAMGTMIYSKGIFINRCFDELNLSAPELISEVHRGYVAAGADVLETNTFGADRHASGRLVSTLEGGYNLQALADSTEAHLRALMHED